MAEEVERKYLLEDIPTEVINDLKNKAKKKIGIIQWYEDEENEGVETRTRLTISYDRILGHTHFWEKTIKRPTDNPQKRIENEETLDPRKDVKIEDLENKKCVMKIRYILKKNPEIVLDEFVKIDTSNNLNKVQNKHYLEIEQTNSEVNFNEELKDLGLENAKDITNIEKYKNKNMAEKINIKPLKMIDYLQNKLIGPVTVILTQGVIKTSNEVLEEKVKKIKKDGKYRELLGEIDSLYLFIKSGFEVQKVHFLVFPPFKGPNCPESYELLKEFVEDLFGLECNYFPIEYYAHNKVSAYKSFQDIFKAVSKFINDDKMSTLIDLTGGQKYPGIELAIYSLFNKKAFYYKQKNEDKKQEMVQLRFPPLPIGWDNETVDDYLTYFNLLLEKTVEEKTLSYNIFTTLPEFLKALFSVSEEGTLITIPILKEIKGQYENARRMPFGHGKNFIDLIKDENMINFINEKIPIWSLRWIGDLIPETVEHSQRHSKRLMEFAFNIVRVIGEENFLNGIDPDLEREFYFILAVAMNVHDLGHTVLNYKTDNNINLCIDGLPSLIRDLHSELSYQLLEETNKNRNLLNEIEKINGNKLEIERLKKAIMYVSKYHRQYLPISSTETHEKKYEDKIFVKSLKMKIESLEERLDQDELFQNDKNWKNMIMLAAMWLKFIDSTDVQSDRTVMKEYTKIRIERTKEEITSLCNDLKANDDVISTLGVSDKIEEVLEYLKAQKWIELDNVSQKIEEIVYEKVSDALKEGIKNGKNFIFVDEYIKKIDRIAFKSRQFLHFQKHQAVRSIIPEFYDHRKNELHLKIYSEEGADKEIITDITKDIKNEFKNSKLSLFNEKVLKLKIES